MLIATPNMLLDTTNEGQTFSYDENSNNTSKDIKNSVNSSSSSVSECSTESSPRPLSSCSPLSGHVQNTFHQTNLQKKSTYLHQPYHNNANPNKHIQTNDNFMSMNTSAYPTGSLLVNHPYAYNQQCQYEYGYNQVAQHHQNTFLANYQGFEMNNQQQVLASAYPNSGDVNMMSNYYPSYGTLNLPNSSGINQAPESKKILKY